MYPTKSYHNALRSAQNNNKEFFSLSSTPHDEECTQAGSDYKIQEMECTAYINQLIRQYGNPPEGATFLIIENYHEFGNYYEAGIFYIEQDETGEDQEPHPSYDYALKCEQGAEKWDDKAKKELKEVGHPHYQPAKVIKMQTA